MAESNENYLWQVLVKVKATGCASLSTFDNHLGHAHAKIVPAGMQSTRAKRVIIYPIHDVCPLRNNIQSMMCAPRVIISNP